MISSLKKMNISRTTKALLLVFVILGASACTNVKNTYHWGEYEQLLYDMYNKPGNAPPEVQVEKLGRDIQKAKRNQKAIPPGVYAHLGTMYAALGKIEAANEAFNIEKSMYPESHVLIDGMLQRAKRAGAKHAGAQPSKAAK